MNIWINKRIYIFIKLPILMPMTMITLRREVMHADHSLCSSLFTQRILEWFMHYFLRVYIYKKDCLTCFLHRKRERKSKSSSSMQLKARELSLECSRIVISSNRQARSAVTLEKITQLIYREELLVYIPHACLLLLKLCSNAFLSPRAKNPAPL